jgi:hypothetical protein
LIKIPQPKKSKNIPGISLCGMIEHLYYQLLRRKSLRISLFISFSAIYSTKQQKTQKNNRGAAG